MKLASLWLDDMVVIAQGRELGGGQPRSDLRDQSYHASEGWDLTETAPGVFRVWREGMAEAVTVGGYGYSYVPLPAPVVERIPVEDLDPDCVSMMEARGRSAAVNAESMAAAQQQGQLGRPRRKK